MGKDNTAVADYSNEHNEYGKEYDQGGDNGYQPIWQLDVNIRRGFIKKVYSILTCQLLFTTIIGALFVYYGPKNNQAIDWNTNENRHIYIACSAIGLAGYLICSCVLCCCANAVRPYPRNYIFLTLLTVFMSLVVGVSTSTFGINEILLAVGVTVGLFLALTLYATFSKTDFTGCGPYLFAASMVIMLFILIVFILKVALPSSYNLDWTRTAISAICCVLFSFYIVYDTQLIIGGPGKKHEYSLDDYAFAAIMLYLDIINLFMSILGLVGSD